MNFLKEEPYNLSFATRGQEALALMRTHDYDLVLLDIMMPEMDGYESVDALKPNRGFRISRLSLSLPKSMSIPSVRDFRPVPSIISANPFTPKSCWQSQYPPDVVPCQETASATQPFSST